MQQRHSNRKPRGKRERLIEEMALIEDEIAHWEVKTKTESDLEVKRVCWVRWQEAKSKLMDYRRALSRLKHRCAVKVARPLFDAASPSKGKVSKRAK